MRKTAVLIAAAILLPQLAAAQMKVQPQPAVQGRVAPLQKANPQAALDAVRRIGHDAAYKLLQEGKAILVDVRSNEQFSLGHIKGAVNIPGSQIVARIRELPPGKMIITYCACSAEQSSGAAVLQLNAHGVKNTAALLGGWAAWQQARLPVSR